MDHSVGVAGVGHASSSNVLVQGRGAAVLGGGGEGGRGGNEGTDDDELHGLEVGNGSFVDGKLKKWEERSCRDVKEDDTE